MIKNENLTKEESERMAQEEITIIKEIAKENKKDLDFFNSQKKYLSEDQLYYLEEEIKGCDYIGNFKIISKPIGNKQQEQGFDMWVNQTTNGGYTGDEFRGDCCILMSNGKYLQWSYSC